MPVPRMGPLRDPSLPHQVVIELQKNTIIVSCNCRAIHKPQGGRSYEPMGPTIDAEDTKALYNNPRNHRKPFGEKDMLTFEEKAW